ncbi:MAG: RNA methyltransferase [Spirochaetales bacterium]|nr:RNA methyltransferase [Spirochaetales bacterium]
MIKTIETVKVVLVSPKDSRNVGAVCRAVKNMGITSLRIVMGGLIDPKKAEILAVNAADVLDNAEIFFTLEDALDGASLVVGVSRRRGKRRKYISYSAEQAAEKMALAQKGWTALLFGNETSGLTNEQLELCHMAVTIPSSPLFPSLNLSHAVQIMAYEVFKAFNRKYTTYFTPASAERLNELTGTVRMSLKEVGFFKLAGEKETGIFFRDIFARAGISESEAKQVEKVFNKIGGITKRKVKL